MNEYEQVDHPLHYGSGPDDPYECIRVIEAWGLGFHLGNAVKYIKRAGNKPDVSTTVDLQKALWYVEHWLAHNPTHPEWVGIDLAAVEIRKAIEKAKV